MLRWLVSYTVEVRAEDYVEAMKQADALIQGFEQLPPQGSYVVKVECFGLEVKQYPHSGGKL